MRLTIPELERRIEMGLRFRGEAFKRTPTYRELSAELERLRIREVWTEKK